MSIGGGPPRKAHIAWPWGNFGGNWQNRIDGNPASTRLYGRNVSDAAPPIKNTNRVCGWCLFLQPGVRARVSAGSCGLRLFTPTPVSAPFHSLRAVILATPAPANGVEVRKHRNSVALESMGCLRTSQTAFLQHWQVVEPLMFLRAMINGTTQPNDVDTDSHGNTDLAVSANAGEKCAAECQQHFCLRSLNGGESEAVPDPMETIDLLRSGHSAGVEGQLIRPRNLKGPQARCNPMLEAVLNGSQSVLCQFRSPCAPPGGGDRTEISGKLTSPFHCGNRVHLSSMKLAATSTSSFSSPRKPWND